LLHRIRKLTRTDAGFTLIELLIVVLILGVLSGIVVFAVGAFNTDGQAAACKADAKNVEIASEAFLAKTGGYASAIDDATHTATTLVGAKYLKEAPPTANGYTIVYASGTGKVTATGACTVT
jgi:prepilin-type N-terminal cleavage/methylation domain-containing protein